MQAKEWNAVIWLRIPLIVWGNWTLGPQLVLLLVVVESFSFAGGSVSPKTGIQNI